MIVVWKDFDSKLVDSNSGDQGLCKPIWRCITTLQYLGTKMQGTFVCVRTMSKKYDNNMQLPYSVVSVGNGLLGPSRDIYIYIYTHTVYIHTQVKTLDVLETWVLTLVYSAWAWQPILHRIFITRFCLRLGPGGAQVLGNYCLCALVRATQITLDFYHMVMTRKNQVLSGHAAYVIKTSLYIYMCTYICVLGKRKPRLFTWPTRVNIQIYAGTSLRSTMVDSIFAADHCRRSTTVSKLPL